MEGRIERSKTQIITCLRSAGSIKDVKKLTNPVDTTYRWRCRFLPSFAGFLDLVFEIDSLPSN